MNATTDRYSFTVTDSAGMQWPNLVGVFARMFPLVTLKAVRGKTEVVTYYGTRYTVAPK